MFKLIKSLFSRPDDQTLIEAIKDGAFLVNIPLDQIEAKLDKFKGKKSIIVFCLSGGRSSQAHVILERNGFDNVLNGGTWNHVASLKKGI